MGVTHRLAALVAVVVVLGVVTGEAQARKTLRVPWTAGAAGAAQSRAPDSSPPGANDYSCKPDGATPTR